MSRIASRIVSAIALTLLILVAPATAIGSTASSSRARSMLGALPVQLNALRHSLGLPVLAEGDDVLVKTAWAVAETSSDEGFVPGFFTEEAVSNFEAHDLYRSFGGTGQVGVALLDDRLGVRASAAQAAPQLTLLDPRARSVAIAPILGGHLFIAAVSLDPAAPFPRPVFFPVGSGLSPRDLIGLAVLLPPRLRGHLVVTTKRGGRTVVVGRGTDLSAAGEHISGAVINGRLRVAYGRTYSLAVGPYTARLAMRPVSRAFMAQGLRFDRSVSTAKRTTLRSALERAPALFRYAVAETASGFRVSVKSGGVPSYATFDPAGVALLGEGSIVLNARSAFSSPETTRHVFYHELGHILDYYGFDEPAHNVFARAFRASSRWRCFPSKDLLALHFNPKACVPFQEILADQIAFWALGDRAGTTHVGYGDPPLLSPAAFGRLFASQFAPAPFRSDFGTILPGLGPR